MKKNLVLVFALCAIPALLQAGEPMDPPLGMSKLTWAARLGDVGTVQRLLLDAGTDVDAAGAGITALMMAARWGKTDIVERLLAAGADVNLVDRSGKTAEQIARDEGYWQIVDLIVDHYGSGGLTKSAGKR